MAGCCMEVAREEKLPFEGKSQTKERERSQQKRSQKKRSQQKRKQEKRGSPESLLCPLIPNKFPSLSLSVLLLTSRK